MDQVIVKRISSPISILCRQHEAERWERSQKAKKGHSQEPCPCQKCGTHEQRNTSESSLPKPYTFSASTHRKGDSMTLIHTCQAVIRTLRSIYQKITALKKNEIPLTLSNKVLIFQRLSSVAVCSVLENSHG